VRHPELSLLCLVDKGQPGQEQRLDDHGSSELRNEGLVGCSQDVVKTEGD
jgi:hypothetical protein